MFKLTQFTGGTPVTREQHDRQRALVLLSTRLSDRRAERAQEAATIARLYPRGEHVENVVPLHPHRPDTAA